MVSLSSLTAVLFTFTFSISTMAAPFIPEPVFFFNLTREEFLLKRMEHRITKRDFVLLEEKNKDQYMQGQRILEALSEVCVEKFGAGQRCYSGRCVQSPGVRKRLRLDFFCNIPTDEHPTYGRRHTSVRCAKGQTCDTAPAFNYFGFRSTFPYCKTTMKIDKKPSVQVEIPPRYEGETPLPNPEETWQFYDELPSPGTIDTHYYMAQESAGRQATWEYRGIWENGWRFLAGSKGLAATFSCLACPIGILYAETIGLTGKAEGFTLPHIPHLEL